MPTPVLMIHITARNLARALRLAEGLSKIEQALDLPIEDRQAIEATVAEGIRVRVSWSAVHEDLLQQRAKLQEELRALGITLMHPDPTEKAGSVMDSIYNSLLPSR